MIFFLKMYNEFIMKAKGANSLAWVCTVIFILFFYEALYQFP